MKTYLQLIRFFFNFEILKVVRREDRAVPQLYVAGFLLLNLLLLSHCASVRVELESPHGKTTSFTHYSHYGFFGLIGGDSIDIQSACMRGKPVNIRNYFSFEDFLFTFTSLGLYTPKSTEIQCELPHQEAFPLEL